MTGTVADKILPGTWNHIGMTFDGTTVTLYCNGNSIGTATASGAPQTISYGNGPWFIGSNPANPSGGVSPHELSFGGIIDDVRIANTTRSASYFKQVYQAGIGQLSTTANLNTITTANAINTNMQLVSTAYGVQSTDADIFCNLSGGSFTVTLPASPKTSEKHTFKDYLGYAATNNLTISGNGKNIEQFIGTTSSTLVLNQNYDAVTLEFDGAIWSIV